MAAGAAPGPELCPHCRRPFKRLRAHLPHCKAAPRPPPPSPPATSPRPAPASAPAPGSPPGTSPQPSPATGGVPGPTPAPAPRPAPGTARDPGVATPGRGPGQPREAAAAGSAGSAEPAVQDVARSLDLHPEDVEDFPRKLQKGVKVVIQKHRARVLREKQPGSGAGAGEGTEPGPAPRPQRPKTAPKPKRKETRSQGAAGNGSGSSKGEKSSLKATKVLQEPPESRSGPGDLVQREGRDKPAAGEEQVHLEAGVGYKAPVSALHPKNLHLSPTELGAHGRETSKNELSSLQGPRDSGERVERVSEPVLKLGTDPGLALLHAPKIQPTCSCRASGGSGRAGAAGLEWFPELYPDYEGLRLFPGKRFQEDVRMIAVETPKGGFSQGQQGPLAERPLMEVRLGELHTWVSTCNFSPQGLLGAVQKAWSSYCAKYIHVRRGGPAGISMLLAGYCLLSYGWNYQHLKQHRWRKYH